MTQGTIRRDVKAGTKKQNPQSNKQQEKDKYVKHKKFKNIS